MGEDSDIATVFPDWVGDSLGATNGSGAFAWWRNEISTWYQNVSFDGIWIDMSEVSSFCVGSCGSGNVSLNPVHRKHHSSPVTVPRLSCFGMFYNATLEDQ
jgi:alpha-glucosidase (family GH31 glycosyl hydrolase)